LIGASREQHQYKQSIIMGLDWIAFEPDEEEKGEWQQCGYFRGKGIAWDPNVEEVMDTNECYGEEDAMKDKGLEGHYMTKDQRSNVIAALETVLKKPQEQIKLEDDDTYEDWEAFVREGLAILVAHDVIWCWW